MADESFYDKITKRIAAAKGTMSAVTSGRTMTGDKPNQILINPDVELRTEESMNEETKWIKDKYGSGYTSSDGKRAIVKHPKGWISRSTTDKHDYSDVYPTQREAKAGKYAWAMEESVNEESINEAANPGAEHFKTVPIGNGEHEVYWKGKKTPYTIFNGSMGASGFGNNIYGIHHKKNGIHRTNGTLHAMKRVLMKALHNDESKATLEEAVDPSEMHRRHHTLFWGRANPPHAGHEAAYNVVKDTARRSGGTSSMVLTRTHDKKKNPLTPEQKEEHAKASFPDVNTRVTDEAHPTILHHLSKLHENGVTDLHLVAGSDRLPDYERLINQYNGVHGNHGYYNFKSVNLHSSGDRDPDAEGVAGISASAMRDHAASGRQDQFEAGAPSKMPAAQRTKMYNDVRAGLASGKKAVKESAEECHLCGRPGCKVHKKKV